MNLAAGGCYIQDHAQLTTPLARVAQLSKSRRSASPNPMQKTSNQQRDCSQPGNIRGFDRNSLSLILGFRAVSLLMRIIQNTLLS